MTFVGMYADTSPYFSQSGGDAGRLPSVTQIRLTTGRAAGLQFVELQTVARVGFDVVVVGVVDGDARIRGTVGDLHDDADHHALEEVPIGVVHLAGKALQVAGFPGAAFDGTGRKCP